jgi:hypothetical protein
MKGRAKQKVVAGRVEIDPGAGGSDKDGRRPRSGGEDPAVTQQDGPLRQRSAVA